MSEWDDVPGLKDEKRQAGETTLVVDAEDLLDAATSLRDEHGFNFLSDITAVDYLGWAGEGVSGYLGTANGRDLNAPSTQSICPKSTQSPVGGG